VGGECEYACDGLSQCESAETCTLVCGVINDLCLYKDCHLTYPKAPSYGDCVEGCAALPAATQAERVQCLSAGSSCTVMIDTCFN
jgi:hypothetical protein